MGRRGPPPKPTNLRVLQGNPGKRPISPREPKPRKTAPRCPEWLSDEAKKVWRRTVPELKALGVLTTIDGDALAGYCATYAQWKEATVFIDKHGMAYPLRDGEGRVKCMQQFPQVAVARGALFLLKAFMQEFGLTPASRSRIQVPWTPDEDEEEQLARRIIG